MQFPVCVSLFLSCSSLYDQSYLFFAAPAALLSSKSTLCCTYLLLCGGFFPTSSSSVLFFQSSDQFLRCSEFIWLCSRQQTSIGSSFYSTVLTLSLLYIDYINLSFYLRKLRENKEQINSKVSRKKNVTNIRAKIDEIKNGKSIGKTN